MSGDMEKTCGLNYEAEYERLSESHKLVCAKYADLLKDFESLETEFGRLRAQMDIVYLIFGGK